jgi:hypothetical protein
MLSCLYPLFPVHLLAKRRENPAKIYQRAAKAYAIYFGLAKSIAYGDRLGS